MTKILAALGIAAALCLAPVTLQAHEGHDHPPKAKKATKKPKPQKQGDIRYIVRDAA